MKALAQKLASLGYYVTEHNEITKISSENQEHFSSNLQSVIENSKSRRVKRRQNDKTRCRTIS